MKASRIDLTAWRRVPFGGASGDQDIVINLTIGAAGIALIKQFEGCARKRPDGRYDAYPDPATGGAPWTIGWGTTGSDVKRGTIWTQAQCDQRFATDAAHFASQVASLIGLPLCRRNGPAQVGSDQGSSRSPAHAQGQALRGGNGSQPGGRTAQGHQRL